MSKNIHTRALPTLHERCTSVLQRFKGLLQKFLCFFSPPKQESETLVTNNYEIQSTWHLVKSIVTAPIFLKDL